ncbi:class I tRNA ligase family protein [Pendulispora brunnea]|uniref:Class I tRNA ligase family protein n=1 Tax=Pendulispora brunnea TaxID=2905690 RepID=A0ABZ2KJS2_9BACT
MSIQRLDSSKLQSAYGIRVQSLYPWQGVVEPPFGAAWAVVAPGEETKHHAHQDAETFFIAKGRGVMRIGDEVYDVQAGDVLYQPPFQSHTLVNTGDAEELLFLTVWWEDLQLWAHERPAPNHRPRRTMVTAAPPTPNGDLHVGHISGPYLAADIHTRYLRLRGVDARYISGSDDNQSYVKTNAARLGMGPQASADLLSYDILTTLTEMGIRLDQFVRPNASPHHGKLARELFRTLKVHGHLVEKEVDSPWCEKCDLYLYEAYIGGRCPHCHAPSGGNICEECGRPNDCADLLEPRCTQCGSAPVRRPTTRLFFPLSRWEKPLREFHRKVAMNPSLRSLCEQAMAAGLPDIAVTHVTDWGIQVPLVGYEDQCIFVWCEMAARYLAHARHLSSVEDYWKSDDGNIVQCFGFDNGFFYAVLLPAIYMAFDPSLRLPSAYLMNEFYHLDGRKFSTSRRHAIWARELAAQVPADMVRFYLSYTRPEVESTNFTREDFKATCTRELLGVWQPWLESLGRRITADFDGVVPATGDWTGEHRAFYNRLGELRDTAASAYEATSFSPQRAARVLCELAREAHRFGQAETVWRRVATRKEERRTAAALELLAAKVLAEAAAPMLPDFAAQLWGHLGYTEPLSEHRWEVHLSWVPPGQKTRALGGASYFSEIT